MKELDSKHNFLGIGKEFSNYKDSQIVILQVPLEKTVSYGKGTHNGPKEIITASHFVEYYDEEQSRELCFEKGICSLSPLTFEKLSIRKSCDKIYNEILKCINDKKFVVVLGGEHSLTTASVKAHNEKYSNLSILHFDAHSDLRESYDDSPYSHACFMARVMNVFPPSRVTQVGIRAQCIEEAQFIKENNVKTFYASAIRRGLHGQDWQKKIVDTLSQQIYVSFDVDYFDPAIMPSTGTPEPDGFLYSETLDIFREIVKSGKQIIGLDVVELAPIKDLHHSDLTAARLLYKILNFAFRL